MASLSELRYIHTNRDRSLVSLLWRKMIDWLQLRQKVVRGEGDPRYPERHDYYTSINL